MSRHQAYTLGQVDSQQHHILNELLSRHVAQLFVEFLRQDDVVKPHVVIKVNVRPAVQFGSEIYYGCRLSMEYMGDPGDFYVTLTPYIESSVKAAVAFQFPVRNTHTTVGAWIKILRGTHRSCPAGHQSDLTQFTFVVAEENDQSLDGCRDFITQCMIRLNVLRIVDWDFIGQGVPNITLVNFQRFVPDNGFHHIIGNNYVLESDEQQGLLLQNLRVGTSNYSTRDRCVISRLPLHRGIFNDPRVQRIETHRGHILPYHRMDQMAQQQAYGFAGEGDVQCGTGFASGSGLSDGYGNLGGGYDGEGDNEQTHGYYQDYNQF